MRVASLVLSATCLLLGTRSYAQNDPCSARVASPKPTEKPLTSAEAAHHVMLTSTLEERRKIYWGDVEFILRCGTQ
jgi:hypothetical protein